jgi:hypothetical protein
MRDGRLWAVCYIDTGGVVATFTDYESARSWKAFNDPHFWCNKRRQNISQMEIVRLEHWPYRPNYGLTRTYGPTQYRE